MAYTHLQHPSTEYIAMRQRQHFERTTPPPTQYSSLEDFDPAYPALEEPEVQRLPPRLTVFVVALDFFWKTIFLPLMGIAYLAFCYSCHYRIIKIGGKANSMEHLPVIKAIVTSISIIFVSISLLPLNSLISDLRSEEFFRVLSSKHSGAPLKSVNNISTPSHGMRDSLVTLYRRHASSYFAGAFFTALVAVAASTLAPAALSVETALFDTNIVALPVSAIERNTIWNSSDFTELDALGEPSSMAPRKASEGGSVAWPELALGVTFSFQSPTVDQTTYIVPAPKFPPDTTAHWLSDVIAVQPKCEWIAPQFQTTGANFSDSSLNNTVTMNLTSQNVQVQLDSFILSEVDSTSFEPLSAGWFTGFGSKGDLIDLDTMDDLTNGATAWALLQCVDKCGFLWDVNVTLGSDIPSSRYSSVDGKVLDISFLFCSPNAKIQTREISNVGRFLSVGNVVSTSQGNLHPIQTNLLLSYALKDMAEVGPDMVNVSSALGNAVQFSLVFGNPSLDSGQILPQSINLITESYGKILQSMTKPFLDGSIASAYVPGRITRELAVFASSLPHVIASTVIYALLSAFVLVCYFRRHVPQFTFFAIAASLARSDIPPLFAQMKELGQGPPSDDDVTTTLGNTRVLYERGQVLQLRREEE